MLFVCVGCQSEGAGNSPYETRSGLSKCCLTNFVAAAWLVGRFEAAVPRKWERAESGEAGFTDLNLNPLDEPRGASALASFGRALWSTRSFERSRSSVFSEVSPRSRGFSPEPASFPSAPKNGRPQHYSAGGSLFSKDILCGL